MALKRTTTKMGECQDAYDLTTPQLFVLLPKRVIYLQSMHTTPPSPIDWTRRLTSKSIKENLSHTPHLPHRKYSALAPKEGVNFRDQRDEIKNSRAEIQCESDVVAPPTIVVMSDWHCDRLRE